MTVKFMPIIFLFVLVYFANFNLFICSQFAASNEASLPDSNIQSTSINLSQKTTSINLNNSTSASTSFQEPESNTVDSKSNFKQIISLLHSKVVQNCEYGDNPPISKICPNFKIGIANSSYKFNSDIYLLKLKDVEEAIVAKTTIHKLKERCQVGEWCLDNDLIATQYLSIGSSILREHSASLCLVASCYDKIKDYIDTCIKSELSRSILNMVPMLCKVNTENNTSEYCLERTVRLVHVTVAAFTNLDKNNSEVTSEINVSAR
jgi:hypothetical protein